MRKLILFSAVAALILQGCSSSREFSKKRYGHLNWIDHDTKVETVGKGLEPATETKNKIDREAVSHLTPEKKNETIPVQEITVNPTNPALPTQTLNNEPLTSEQNPSSNEQDHTGEGSVSHEEGNNNDVSEEVNITKSELLVQPTKPQLDGDALLILCIVLCFLIPPLAMYVWNQSVDGLFILDLVLFLFWVGLFLGYGWGLIALASIIIALLRVLDII